MPWYWTDDIARFLLAEQRISQSTATTLQAQPIALRRSEESLEEAAMAAMDDDEIPLAA
jgi:hypothetical protein